MVLTSNATLLVQLPPGIQVQAGAIGALENRIQTTDGTGHQPNHLMKNTPVCLKSDMMMNLTLH